jgi:membrane-associated PAP2 superfamily phosphatase
MRVRAQSTALALVGAALLLLLWDVSGLDLAVMRFLGSSQGFALRDAMVTRTVLHEGGRLLAFACMAWLVVSIRWPSGPMSHLARSERLWVLITCVLCLVTISLLKRASATSCPWSLAEFGGIAHYVPHWHWGQPDGGGGGCFPSGHASSAFAYLPIGWALWAHNRGLARRWLLGIAVFGLAIGTGQTLRGAHYPSHTLWTAWFCAALTAASWHAWQGMKALKLRRN